MVFKRRYGFFTSQIYLSTKFFSLVCNRVGVPKPQLWSDTGSSEPIKLLWNFGSDQFHGFD
jgi:hypothetical protein